MKSLDTFLMHPQIVKRFALLIVIVLIATSCGGETIDREGRHTVLHLPMYRGCDGAIEKVRAVTEYTTKSSGLSIDITTTAFDVTAPYTGGYIGFVTLDLHGDWDGVEGSTPEEYLRIWANGILQQCMPNNWTDIAWEDLEQMRHAGDMISRRGVLRTQITDTGVRVFFNDASYDLPGVGGDVQNSVSQ